MKYVDDLISGAPTPDRAKHLKREATNIFPDAKFELHKWHSHKKWLETSCEDYKPSFAKEHLENGNAAGEHYKDFLLRLLFIAGYTVQ